MSESFLQARRFFSVCMSCWGWWRQWLHQKYGRLPAMDCGRQTHFPQVGVWGNIFQYVSARFNSFFAHLTLQQNITLWSTHCASGASPGTWGLLVIGLNFQRPGRPGLSCPASHRCPPMLLVFQQRIQNAKICKVQHKGTYHIGGICWEMFRFSGRQFQHM